jgi:putative transposase
MKTIAETLGVARSNLYDRLEGTTHPRGRYHRRGDAELLARITRLVTARPTYGYRRITAVLNRELKAEALPPANRESIASCRCTGCCWRVVIPSAQITSTTARS